MTFQFETDYEGDRCDFGCLDQLGEFSGTHLLETCTNIYDLKRFPVQRMVRDYSPQKWENCPIQTPMSIQMSIPKSNINTLKMSGLITAAVEVPGDIELVVEANKCTLDMMTCEKYAGVSVRELCKRFKVKGAFYSNVIASIKPPLQCPIKAGNYTMEESTFDLSMLSVLPLDGYIWVVTFKLMSAENGKTKKIAMCLNSETKIFRTSRKSPT